MCVNNYSNNICKKSANNLVVSTFCINTHTHTHRNPSINLDTIQQCRILNLCPGVTAVAFGLFLSCLFVLKNQ